jgi:uncharacterized protein YgbK (DUF1537 family)
MNPDDRWLLGFYGDDFTGSTDALEALSLGGVRSVLFLHSPDPGAALDRFASARAFGVAGVSRSMTPARMDGELTEAFRSVAPLLPAVFHYKTCSTFDSSPEVGSIGRAIDIGRAVFGTRPVPLVVGVPALRRYCVFGNLFAAAGDTVHRLDRHPTMSRHPVTPMDEADLRVHLSRQTSASVALMDVVTISGPRDHADRRFEEVLAESPDVVLFDVIDEPSLAVVGRWIWSRRGDRTVFAVGSSGVEYALTAHWRASGLVPEPEPFRPPGLAERLVVVSGSCSPATREQIERAVSHGFAAVEVDATRLVDPVLAPEEQATAVRRARAALVDSPGVVIYSAMGPDDPRIAATLSRESDSNEVRRRLGDRLGSILRELLDASGVRRVVVAGGDTSGQVVRRLGLDAIEVVYPMAPGAPLCRASAPGSPFDGLEIVLKGGQVGGPDLFETVRRGGPA